MEYYLFLSEEQKGPYTLSQLQTMWRSGNITGNTLFWQEGCSEWNPLSSILHVLEPPLAAPAPSLPRALALLGEFFDLPPAAPAPSLSRASAKQTSTSTIPNPLSFSWGTPKEAIIVAASLLTIVIILGFLHIVRGADGMPRAVVAKEHFTYSMTFVSLDDLISRYNDRSIAEAQRVRKDLPDE